jgi:hypothetical protein
MKEEKPTGNRTCQNPLDIELDQTYIALKITNRTSHKIQLT